LAVSNGRWPRVPSLATGSGSPTNVDRRARFLKRELSQIGADAPEATKQKIARAMLETELTWSYSGTGTGRFLGGEQYFDDASKSPMWMTHFVDTLKTAGLVPVNTSDWSAGDVKMNKQLLAYMSGLVEREGWSHSGGIAKLQRLVSEGQALIVREFLEMEERDSNVGVWQLQLELGKVLEEAPNIDLTLRAYGTVIVWNEVSSSNTPVTELL